MKTQDSAIHIQSSPLQLPTSLPENSTIGGFVTFTGIVREVNEGKRVLRLEYEAYPEMASAMIANILKDAGQKWDLLYTDCKHRIGELEVGEIAVLVFTGSMHREEAYQANRYIIDRVKHEVPIWKKEYYEDGSSEWSKGCQHEHQS